VRRWVGGTGLRVGGGDWKEEKEDGAQRDAGVQASQGWVGWGLEGGGGRWDGLS
jgi:hypothetical protein